MNETALTAETVPVAVIMQRTALDNPWVSEEWEAHGIVYDEDLPGAEPRIIVDRADVPQVLYPGFRLRLQRDEAEGYYLNDLTGAEGVRIVALAGRAAAAGARHGELRRGGAAATK